MANNTGAFKDSDIDTSDMMTDPHKFAERVFEKAEYYREVCKADISVAAFTRVMEKTKQPADSSIHALCNGIYDYASEAPLNQFPDTIAVVRQLVKDLEIAFGDRCVRETAAQTDAIQDKRMAHLMYIDLRKAYTAYAELMNSFGLSGTKEQPLPELPALPGNYGSQTATHKMYVYEFKGEQFRNVPAVCRELGIDRLTSPERLNAFLEDHPEYDVKVKELT